MKFTFKFLAVSTSALLIPVGTWAQDDPLLQDTIVVEGNRSNPMLADVQPDIALNVSEIRSYGAASLEELLADLEPLTESSASEAPAILLNGRRISGFREIRNYPPEALARVEILPEEAALKFGFSANQKVINFVLRDRFHAVTARTSVGAPTEGGQWLGDVDMSTLRLRDDQRWNVDVQYAFRNALFESDRDIVGEEPELTADRSLLPQEESLDLTASISHFLPGDVSASYVAGLEVAERTLSVAQSDLTDTLARQTNEIGGEARFVLNKVYSDWNWTLYGGYAVQDTETETAIDPITGFEEATSTTEQDATLEGVLFRKLFSLPAGDVVSTVKVGFDASDISSRSELNLVFEEVDLSRTESNGQLNIDMPVLKAAQDNNPFGSLSLNANVRIDDVSDFGTLYAFGGGVTWHPTDSLQVLASTALSETAPELTSLGAPTSITETARVFDFSTRETVEDVTRISGGNPDLTSEERRIHRVNLNWDPFETPDITFNLTYTDTEIEDAITAFPALTPQIEAVFADRVMRDTDGQLVSLDARAINIDRSNTRELRYGFNWSHTLPRGERPDLSDDERSQLRDIFLQRLDEEERAAAQARIAEREARREAGQGRGADAGQGRGQGGARGGRGGRGSGRIFASFYHTYLLEDSLQLAPESATLDLLMGDAIGEDGGSARHRVTGQIGYAKGAVGAFMRANWRSATEFDDGENGALKFDDLATLSLRVQYNFGSNPHLLLKYPVLDSTRIALSVDNVFDAKQRVTDVAGLTPIIYQPDLLDAQGRIVMLRFRKLFY